MRGKTMPEFHDIKGGVAAALAFNAAPVVMAEPSDNAGGGAPSDNTSILRELVARGADNAALGPIWDPIAGRLCFDAAEKIETLESAPFDGTRLGETVQRLLHPSPAPHRPDPPTR